MEYTISDLAREFDVTPRTLRFYEEKGLLNPARRGQQRIYSPADRTRLRLVLRGKRMGLTLEESAEIIGMYNPGASNLEQLAKLLAAIREKKSMLGKQLEELQLLLVELCEYEQRTLAAMKNAQETRSHPHPELYEAGKRNDDL